MQLLVLAAALTVWTSLSVQAEGRKQYGERLAGGEEASVASILQDPLAWEGRTVRVRGKVKDVCRKMGCWMEIEDASAAAIQIKVDDGVIVFPVDAVGRRAVAEGRVEVRELTREQYLEWRRHLAEEQGKPFSPSEVGDPPYRVVRLRGLGAEIEQ
jgi:hypothetical protein